MTETAMLDLGYLHSQNLPALLQSCGISLALTSYQLHRVMLVRSQDAGLDILFQEIPRPMGLARTPDRLVVGSWAQVLDYRRQDQFAVAQAGEEGGSPIDACFIPRGSFVTGNINVHDIAWGKDGLWMVNTAFSCLATLSPEYNFVPHWKPDFVTDLTPEDRCHLNGMAMRDGAPAFVTTFCQGNTPDAWRSFEADGCVIRVSDQQRLADGLSMPHSPRWIDDWLYFCESGHGRVWRCREDGSERTLIAELPGYTRGLDHWGTLLFVGLSHPRVSEGAPPLPLSEREERPVSGFWVIDLASMTEVAWLVFTGDLSQIYDLVVMPEMTFPHLVSWQSEDFEHCYRFPQISAQAMQGCSSSDE